MSRLRWKLDANNRVGAEKPRKLISAVGDGRPITAMSKAAYSATKQQAPQALLEKDHEATPVMLRSAEPTVEIGGLRLTTSHLYIISK